MKEQQRNSLPGLIHFKPGDRLICTVKERKTKKTHRFEAKIGRVMTIDTRVTFDLDMATLGPEAGGIGAMFGKAVT